MKHHSYCSLLKILRYSGISLLCSVTAFVIGMQTAGDVHPLETSQAALADVVEALPGSIISLDGDINGNGTLDINDVIRILEVADGLEAADLATIRQGDTDGDFRLTVSDALRILHSLSLQ